MESHGDRFRELALGVVAAGNKTAESARFLHEVSPHWGQTPRLGSSTIEIVPSFSTFTFFLLLQAGLPLHTRYSPFLPQRSTMFLPHFSHLMEVSFSSCFRFFIVFFAADSSSCRVA